MAENMTVKSLMEYIKTLGSGGGGDEPSITSYNDLTDKPSIEGESLVGDKTASQFGLATEDYADSIRGKIFYGQVDSTSTATNFTAQIEGITEYVDGLAVMLKNGVVASKAGFTININGLGAKHAYNNMTAGTAESTIFDDAYTMLFVYDSTRVEGGGWICYRGYNSNTTYGSMSVAEMQAGTASTGRLVTAARLKQAVEYHAPVKDVTVNGTSVVSSDIAEIDLSDYATKSDISSVYKFKGTVANYSGLPSSGQSEGDVYNITNADSTHDINAGDNVAWTGSAWDKLAGEIDLSNYVEKEVGKGLSSNDYTTTEKDKLAGIASGAEVNVQSDWNQDTASADDYIKNKPTIPTKTSDLNNDSGFIDSTALPTKVSDLDNDAGYITGYTETDPVFTASVAHDITSSDVANWNGKSDFSGDYDDLSNKPTIPQVGLTIPYGYCQTAAATKAKVVTVSPTITELTTGLTIAVRFQYANTSSSPTLNVNELGAVSIYRYGTTVVGTNAGASWNAQAVVMLTYNGSGWILNDFNNTTYSGMTDAEYQAGTSTTNRLIAPSRLKAAIELHAPVSSVNGQTGDVVVTVPTKTADPTNDSNFVSDASYVHTDNNYTSTDKAKVDSINSEGTIAYYKKLEGSYTTTGSSTSTIPIPISSYSTADMLLVDINGLGIVEGTEYTISGTNIVLTTPITETGQIVHFVALRAVTASSTDIQTLKGDTGDAAGFGTPTASIDANIGTPSVTVTASGADTAKVFDFAFHNLKGAKGDTGETGGTYTKSQMVDMFYPVGSYYETSDTTFNPNTAWGGTWELEAEGLVHIGSGSNYTVGDTGGEATHKLTKEESGLPKHGHTYTRPTVVSGGGGHTHTVHTKYTSDRLASGTARAQYYGSGASVSNNMAYIDSGTGTHSHTLTGGGVADNNGFDATTAHNNMQPYIVVNRWHRTA